VGGVGSWAAEALARSGLGALTLIDPDEICPSNINRQLPALHSNTGRLKIDVLRERIADISPDCHVETRAEFLLPTNSDRLLAPPFDYVLDAVDRMSIKALIINHVSTTGRRVITVGGSGGRKNPAAIQVADLGVTGKDALLRQVRKKLRRSYGWARGGGHTYGVPAVFSTEPQVYPSADGSISCLAPDDPLLRLDCAEGFGSATFVTGSFAFHAVARIVQDLVADPGV
jgi:tRNA A37 threonylcarbamoyladenosine dehydratase